MYSNIKVYQKYLVTSIKVGCATRSLYASSGPKAEGVPTNNQRGRGSGPCRLWGGLDKARHIVPTANQFNSTQLNVKQTSITSPHAFVSGTVYGMDIAREDEK